jgi:outer membrane protein OmpA-like peptidoglycan-associated protein
MLHRPPDKILIKIFAGLARSGRYFGDRHRRISDPEAKGICLMRFSTLSSAALMLVVAGGAPALAQTAENTPWVELETTSVALGIGGQSGDGVLRLPNLGTNCAYAFKVDGFGAGIKVGISKVAASGPVAGMTKVGDLAGDYGATEGSVTLIAGAGGMSMKNRKNNVVMNLKSETQGLDLGFGAQGMTIKFQEPPQNAPRAYIVEFGFNKTWVNQDSRVTLDQLVKAWKCRYANIWLFGHTDSVGKEDTNLELSGKRASSVRDYLVGAGIVPTRVFTQPKGEDPQLARTADSVRLRTNRAVVIVVQ